MSPPIRTTVLANAVGSNIRSGHEHEIALRRLGRTPHVTIMALESWVFGLLGDAADSRFRAVARILKDHRESEEKEERWKETRGRGRAML